MAKTRNTPGKIQKTSSKTNSFFVLIGSSVPAEEAEWPSAGLRLQEETERESPSGGGPTGLEQVHHLQRAGGEEYVRPAAERRESDSNGLK